MYRKYSIGFLIVTIALVLTLSLAYRISYNNAKEKYENESGKNTRNESESYYYITESNGYVIVYESDQKTVYEYTTISVEELPEKIRESVKKGIKVDSIGQVYGFLENYSS